MKGNVKLRNFGFVNEPPCLHVFYYLIDGDGNRGKSRHRTIPVKAIPRSIRNQLSTLGLQSLVDELYDRHGIYLECVPQNIVLDAIARLLDYHNLDTMGGGKYTLPTVIGKNIPAKLPTKRHLKIDLNKLDDDELNEIKQEMDKDFEKNRVHPSDPTFIYNRKVDFAQATEKNDWDTDSDQDIDNPVPTLNGAQGDAERNLKSIQIGKEIETHQNTEYEVSKVKKPVAEPSVAKETVKSPKFGIERDSVSKDMQPKDEYKEEIDDFEEEIEIAEESEDEEFSKLLAKTKTVNNDSVKDKTTSEILEDKKIEVPVKTEPKKSFLADLPPLEKKPLSSLAGLPPLPGMKSSSKETSMGNTKNDYGYEDDFEAGHTDEEEAEEIKFSDDGLSYSSGEEAVF